MGFGGDIFGFGGANAGSGGDDRRWVRFLSLLSVSAFDTDGLDREDILENAFNPISINDTLNIDGEKYGKDDARVRSSGILTVVRCCRTTQKKHEISSGLNTKSIDTENPSVQRTCL